MPKLKYLKVNGKNFIIVVVSDFFGFALSFDAFDFDFLRCFLMARKSVSGTEFEVGVGTFGRGLGDIWGTLESEMEGIGWEFGLKTWRKLTI